LGVIRDIIDDRIDVVIRGTMGLTVSCARCHDHKYDAIPTADYYSLYGVFDCSVEKQVVLDLSNTDESYREELSAAASDRVRQRLADYLFAQTELEKYPADGFDQIFETTDLLPAFVDPPSSMREVCDRYAETLLAEDNRLAGCAIH
jgi:hypothetical protein